MFSALKVHANMQIGICRRRIICGIKPVNVQLAGIFNRILEARNLAQKAENLAEMGALKRAFTMFALTMMAAYTKRTSC